MLKLIERASRRSLMCCGQGRFGADNGAPGVSLSVRHPASIVTIIARKDKASRARPGGRRALTARRCRQPASRAAARLRLRSTGAAPSNGMRSPMVSREGELYRDLKETLERTCLAAPIKAMAGSSFASPAPRRAPCSQGHAGRSSSERFGDRELRRSLRWRMSASIWCGPATMLSSFRSFAAFRRISGNGSRRWRKSSAIRSRRFSRTFLSFALGFLPSRFASSQLFC